MPPKRGVRERYWVVGVERVSDKNGLEDRSIREDLECTSKESGQAAVLCQPFDPE